MPWRTSRPHAAGVPSLHGLPCQDGRHAQRQSPQHVFEHLVQVTVTQTRVLRRNALDRGRHQRVHMQGGVVERLHISPSWHLLNQKARVVPFLRVVSIPKDVFEQLHAPWAVRCLATTVQTMEADMPRRHAVPPLEVLHAQGCCLPVQRGCWFALRASHRVHRGGPATAGVRTPRTQVLLSEQGDLLCQLPKKKVP